MDNLRTLLFKIAVLAGLTVLISTNPTVVRVVGQTLPALNLESPVLISSLLSLFCAMAVLSLAAALTKDREGSQTNKRPTKDLVIEESPWRDHRPRNL